MAKVIQILLIEDTEDDAFIVEIGLQSSGIKCKIHRANNGIEALDFLYQRGTFMGAVKPDLILCDVKMPKKNGIEFLHEMHRNPDFQTIPLCILIGSEMDIEYLNPFIDGKTNCYVVKGIESVAEKLKEIMNDSCCDKWTTIEPVFDQISTNRGL